MRRHRFIGNFDFSSSQIKISNPEMVYQWRRVLRLTPADEVILVDQNSLQEAVAKIISFLPDSVVVEIVSTKHLDTESDKQINLYCAVLKKENFELVVQKATECGVTKIIPLITERTVKQNIKLERLQKIATEACEQSGRGQVPIIEEVQNFNLLDMPGDSHSVYFFSTEAEAGSATFPEDLNEVNIFIGPEGGWTEQEIAQAKAKKWHIVSLGSRILRAETAAIVAT